MSFPKQVTPAAALSFMLMAHSSGPVDSVGEAAHLLGIRLWHLDHLQSGRAQPAVWIASLLLDAPVPAPSVPGSVTVTSTGNVGLIRFSVATWNPDGAYTTRGAWMDGDVYEKSKGQLIAVNRLCQGRNTDHVEAGRGGTTRIVRRIIEAQVPGKHGSRFRYPPRAREAAQAWLRARGEKWD